MIRRTALVRRHEGAQPLPRRRARPGQDTAEIPVALMGAQPPHRGDRRPDAAASRSTRCSPRWPTRRGCPAGAAPTCCSCCRPARCGSPTRSPPHTGRSACVHVIDEPLISASAVWNAMLGIWNLVKLQPAWEAPAALGRHGFAFKVADLSTSPQPAVAVAAAPVGAPRPRRARPRAGAPGAARHAADGRHARLRGGGRHHRPRARARSCAKTSRSTWT